MQQGDTASPPDCPCQASQLGHEISSRIISGFLGGLVHTGLLVSRVSPAHLRVVRRERTRASRAFTTHQASCSTVDKKKNPIWSTQQIYGLRLIRAFRMSKPRLRVKVSGPRARHVAEPGFEPRPMKHHCACCLCGAHEAGSFTPAVISRRWDAPQERESSCLCLRTPYACVLSTPPGSSCPAGAT